MRSQRQSSLRRAISLDRISATLRGKKRSSLAMSPQERILEQDSPVSSDFRIATHRTSHPQFLFWVVLSRDLSPDITELERRTCPVCDEKFPDRKVMLQHVCECPRLANGCYRCIHCKETEKIGRYHVNGCKNIRVCQDSWLKRMLSFRSAILVDDSEATTQATSSSHWERHELPAAGLIELAATLYVDEEQHELPAEGLVELAASLDAVEAESSPAPQWSELEGDWPVVDLYGGAEQSMSDPPPLYQENVPVLESQWYSSDPAGQSIFEMDAWHPSELAGDDIACFRTCSQDYSAASHQTDIRVLEPVMESINDVPVSDAVDLDSELDQLLLQLAIPNSSWQHTTTSPNDGHNVATYMDSDQRNHTVQEVESSMDTIEIQHRSFDTQFPSPLNSPMIRPEYEIPVSPIEGSISLGSMSGTSIFSSLSSILMDDTPSSSFSLDTGHGNSATTHVFSDQEFCAEPEEMEFVPTPQDTKTFVVNEASWPQRGSEVNRMHVTSMVVDEPEAAIGTSDLRSVGWMVAQGTIPAGDLVRPPNAHETSNLESNMLSDCVPSWVEVQRTMSGESNFTMSDSDHQDGCDSHQSVFSSPTNARPNPNRTLSSDSNMSSIDSFVTSTSDSQCSLTRSPALRSSYKCNYGACLFAPTGKRAYHKRTLQRHQQRCPYSPFPRDKKPCKCNFRGCDKAFSRGDGLKEHRKTSGHHTDVELHFRKETREA